MNGIQELEEITVRIPSARASELYRLASAWREEVGGLVARTDAPSPSPDSNAEGAWSEGDQEIAQAVWSAGNDNARTVYRMLVEAAGSPVSGSALAEAVGLADGPNQFPGLLGAIGRTTWSRKRQVPWHWDPAANTYTMSPTVARLFANAAERR